MESGAGPKGEYVCRCAVCSSNVFSASAWRCPGCDSVLHERCSDWIGGCATFACSCAGSPARRLRQYACHCADLYRRKRLLEAAVLLLATLVSCGTGPLAKFLVFGLAGAWTISRAATAHVALARIDDGEHHEEPDLPALRPWLVLPDHLGPHRSFLMAIFHLTVGPAVVLLDLFAMPALALDQGTTLPATLVGISLWLAYRSSPWHISYVSWRAETLAGLWKDEIDAARQGEAALEAVIKGKAGGQGVKPEQRRCASFPAGSSSL